MQIFRALLAASVVALALSAGSAWAGTLKGNIALSASNEVPPNNSTATGTASVSFDADSRVLKWHIVYSGLSGPAIAMHFHGPTEPGKNAGILVPVTGSLASPVEGSVTLTEPQSADLTAGKWYINIHTAQHPGGELRGQVILK